MAVSPVMPGSMRKLLEAMGVPEDLRTIEGICTTWYSPLAERHYRLDQPVGLFPRLELPEGADA